jgi:hypothetical protein
MKRRGIRLKPGHRWTFHAIGLALLISGLAWTWLHRLDEAGSAGGSWHEFKPWLMKAHGFSAMGFVLLLGTLLPVHVRHAWHARRNRANGAFFLGAVVVLTLTGYALYYAGGEKFRVLCSGVHFWLGILSPLLLLGHVRTGRRATRNGGPQS